MLEKVQLVKRVFYQQSLIKMYQQKLRSHEYGSCPPSPSNEAENLRSNFSSGDFGAPCTVASEHRPTQKNLMGNQGSKS